MIDITKLIAELRVLLSKANPLVWHSCPAGDGECSCQGIFDDQGIDIARFYGNDELSIDGVTPQCPSVEEGIAYRRLVVGAVNSLPTLLYRIEEQEREIERLRGVIEDIAEGDSFRNLPNIANAALKGTP